ncbi:MAG: 3-phosphoshikimate 1-carboxyvinyltransferase [Fimbriimonadales bacterium]
MTRSWRVKGGHPLVGRVNCPPDKSISHRALILGALAEGTTNIRNLLEGEDCLATARILRHLGVPVERLGPGEWSVTGGPLSEPQDVLNAGNSGTTIRLMAGVLAGCPFLSVITGDDSLRRRPMARIVEPLRRMGAMVDGREGGRLAPLTIRGGKLRGIRYESPVASAQVKSCVLLAGLRAEGETVVTEPSLSRDHTERMLTAFGAEVERSDLSVAVRGGATLRAADVEVPGDVSSAAFPLVAGLIVPGSSVEVFGVGDNPTRTGLLEVLIGAGADLAVTERREEAGEPVANMTARHCTLSGLSAAGDLVVRMVDEVPVFAVAATQSDGFTELSSASELRHKESDRLATITGELRKMGADIRDTHDGLLARGPTRLRGAVVCSHGDHRIAMSLAVAGLAAEGETVVEDVECVDTSFPGFVEMMRSLGADIRET